jgi:phosphoenolpyruvate synthase/pyruvate phosphate dikinase
MTGDAPHVIWFENLRRGDVARVGGKNASLGEMVGHLGAQGVSVPPGFATTADAYWRFVEANRLQEAIEGALDDFKAGKGSLQETGQDIRRAFLRSDWPNETAQELLEAYRELSNRSGAADTDVAVRSSATAEDLPDASFAGQQETFLNIRGETALHDACRRCYASLFTDRAISYREAKGFDHLKVALSVGVQKMVRSDLGGAGVMFSIDTETGFDKVAVIDAAWGLGENVVQGTVDPDEYQVFKPLLDDTALAPIIEKKLGGKALKMLYATGAERATRNVPTSTVERASFVLDDQEILQLARWACTIEAHYGMPMDMEWAKDGNSGKLYIVQARPETVQSRKDAGALKSYRIKSKGRKLVEGLSIGDAVVAGKVCLIRSAQEIERFEDGTILVTETTDPDWVPIMKRAAAIVTDHSPRYRDGFALECRAIRRLREEMGLRNVVVMIPFCRSTNEADRVLEVMAENGLRRGENGLEVYVMCEIPSNVVLATAFAERFDGFSIGSNDLTQLTLGGDRDSDELAELFDEQDEAVKWMIRTVIEAAHRSGAKVGLCGQAPSDHPAFAEFLVACGIDSMCVSPDSFIAVKRHVAAAEAERRDADRLLLGEQPAAREGQLCAVEDG